MTPQPATPRSSDERIGANDLATVLVPPSPPPTKAREGAEGSPRAEEPRKAAVAAVFRPGPIDTELLFIQRASFDGDPWSGQMAFPGGRVEPSDADTATTAERETAEELGLDLRPVQRLGDLAEVDGGHATNRPIQVAGHCYWLEGPRPELTPNYEVADVIWISLSHLLDETRYIEYWYREAETPFPGIQLNHPDQVIWGLTLRFLADLFQRLERPFII